MTAVLQVLLKTGIPREADKNPRSGKEQADLHAVQIHQLLPAL